MSWRGANSGYALRQAHPETPAHPALLGKPERDFKINIKSQVSCSIVGASLGAILFQWFLVAKQSHRATLLYTIRF
jgi:hypothetical protein